MGKFLLEQWTEVTSMTGAQWVLVIILSILLGIVLFNLAGGLRSRSFGAVRNTTLFKQNAIYAGSAPTNESSPTVPLQILPRDWEPPCVEQAIAQLEQQLEAHQGGQHGANRTSANVGFVLDSKLLDRYVRLYEKLSQAERVALLTEQAEWLKSRYTRSRAAVESGGGTLAPLEFNLAFIRETKSRICEIERRMTDNQYKQTGEESQQN